MRISSVEYGRFKFHPVELMKMHGDDNIHYVDRSTKKNKR